MNKQEIVNKLVSYINFHEYVEICLKENLKIEKLKYAPTINIWYDEDDYYDDTLDRSMEYIKINLKKITFEVDGKILSGTNNFFKHYKKITKIIQGGLIYFVKPDKKCWYNDVENEDYSINYILHSYNESSVQTVRTDIGVESKYCVDGVRFDYKDWINICRKEKLKYILK